MTAERFDLERFLLFRMHKASEALSLQFALQYKRLYGMTRAEWRALAVLARYSSLSASQISRYTGIHKTKISRAVAKLEKRLWLKRCLSPHDLRMETLELTPLGFSHYTKLAELALAYERQLEAMLGNQAVEGLTVGLEAVEGFVVKKHRFGQRRN